MFVSSPAEVSWTALSCGSEGGVEIGHTAAKFPLVATLLARY